MQGSAGIAGLVSAGVGQPRKGGSQNDCRFRAGLSEALSSDAEGCGGGVGRCGFFFQPRITSRERVFGSSGRPSLLEASKTAASLHISLCAGR